MTSHALLIERITLVAGVKTPITASRSSNEVNVCASVAGGDVEVHTTDDDDQHYITLAAGYERPFEPKRFSFRPDEVAFWLKSAAGGLVILIWE